MKYTGLTEKLRLLAPVATMLLLMLCCVSCSTTRKYFPAISTNRTGNAILATLPPGTELRLYENTDEFSRAFVNETRIITNTHPGCMVLKTITPLKIATPAYISERDRRELLYLQLIENLKLQNNNTSK